MRRRSFIKTISITGALSYLGHSSLIPSQKKKLNILVLGGTYFVGPAIVNAAIQNGHNVTLFNRGITNPNLFPDLNYIKGDRTDGIHAYQGLGNQKWDVVIDVWPEHSYLVDEATQYLKNKTAQYIYISSIAVYNNFQVVGLKEDSEVVSLIKDVSEWNYPEEKLAAENYVRQRFPKKHIILRAGAIKGWRDPAYDLYYWCHQLSKYEKIVAPGSGNDPLQYIDVKDVGRISILGAESKIQGTYNCIGPEKKMLWKQFLSKAKSHFKSKSELVWMDEDFLSDNNVYSFSDLPLWAPLSEDIGFMQISNQKLINYGFSFIPLEDTLTDCMKWNELNLADEIKFGSVEIGLGLDRKFELDLLKRYMK